MFQLNSYLTKKKETRPFIAEAQIVFIIIIQLLCTLLRAITDF